MRPDPASKTSPGDLVAGVVVFDLDGTLVDSLPDLTTALNRLLTEEGLTPLSLAETRDFVGAGAKTLIERGFTHRGVAAPDDALSRFLVYYEACLTVETRAFPGVEAALASLAASGWRLAVCTNKGEELSRRLLEGLKLDHWFAIVIGGDSLPVRKPDPGHILGTLALVSGDPARAIMVGDSVNDIQAARAAGLPSVAVDWGYTTVPAADLGATRLISDMADLPAVVRDLLP